MYHQTITYQVTGAICYASHIVISRRVPHWGNYTMTTKTE